MTRKEILIAFKEGRLTAEEVREKLREMEISSSRFSLSEGQKGLWMLQKANPDMSAYNVPICLRVIGHMDIEKLNKAFCAVTGAHPILNSVIEEDNGIPYRISKALNYFDFRNENISEMDFQDILPYIRKKAKEPFSLKSGPLLRVNVLSRTENEHFILITVHHIIFDGTSTVILIETLLDAYKKLYTEDSVEIFKPSSEYDKFVIWEQKMLSEKEGEGHSLYWKQQLGGTLPVIEISSDYPRTVNQTFEGSVFTQVISEELGDRIKAFSKKNHISLSAVFLGVLKTLLYRYTGQNDIIIGMPAMERNQECFSDAIGYFINMIPIRSRRIGSQTFTNFVKELQMTMADGIDHSEYPFPAIVRDLKVPRTQANMPVFQVVYSYQNFFQSEALVKLQNQYKDVIQIEFVDGIHQDGEYEFELEVFEQESRFALNIKYNPGLFEQSSIIRTMSHYINLMEQIIKEPDASLNKYDLMTEEEQKEVLFDWNSTEKEYPKATCFHKLFEQQAQKTPKEIAVVFENETMTYKELDGRSTMLAVYLQNQGVRPDSLVGICTERSLDMIVGLLGIMKAGGAYVPIDPGYPAERLKYMVTDSKVPLILTQSRLMDKVKEIAGENINIAIIDEEWARIEESAAGKTLKREVGTDNLAYVIYTSGSTGNPKGVMIPHKALTNFLVSMSEIPGLAADDKLLAVTTYCFDIAGLELYLPLIKGARCYICSAEKTKDTEKLKHEIHRIKPTIIQATPVTWTMLFSTGWKNEERVKILCGGEALPKALRQHFVDNSCDVWNMYGPTETTIWSTVQHVTEHETVTIGKPIANTQVYIVDKNLKATPIGIPGELCIGGDGLARGYLNLPALSTEKFIDNPFRQGEKLYRTGDLARWLNNGNIEYLGRMDHQVKIRGFRIELGEIETQLRTHQDIKECAVVIKENEGAKQLAAYYVLKDGESHIDARNLREYLRINLPEYMIPTFFIKLDNIPLTSNGKINRKELMNRKIEIKKNTVATSPVSKIEEKVLNIWKSVLKVNEIGMEDGFFDVGGDSALAIVLSERIKKEFNCDITVTSIFKYSNVKELSTFISELGHEYCTFEDTDDNKMKLNRTLTEKSVMQKVGNKTYPDYYKDSLAIIGISCQFPGANNCSEFWELLKDGKECIRFFSEEELNRFGISKEVMDNPNYVPMQSTIEGKDLFDPDFFNISHKDAEIMDPQMRLLLLHSWRAIEDAGYSPKKVPDTGVYMSASNNFYQAIIRDNSNKVMSNSDDYVSWVLAQGGTIPTMISHKLGLKGPSYFVHSNCSSSLVGLYSAYQSIKSGESKYALVGASTILPVTNLGYVHQPGLNFSSDGHCKAFDASADGMVTGEGVAVVFLKRAVDAVEDGDRIYSILRGIGINNDGADKVGFYAPSAKGQGEIIQKVLESTQISPDSISYVEAHGTGTKLGDPIEFGALCDVYKRFTNERQFCGLGSVKTNIGHMDTAAGLAGCIKVALSLFHNEIPPSLNFRNPNPNMDLKNSPFYIADKPKVLDSTSKPHRAALSAFGLGGTNAHAVFEQYDNIITDRFCRNDLQQIIPISAKNNDRLMDYVQELFDFIKSQKDSSFKLDELAYTLQVGREPMEARVSFIVNSTEELLEKMEKYLDKIDNINNCFKGNTKNQNDILRLFTDDEHFESILAEWIEKGKTKNIAELWAKGLQINWETFYTENKPRRISIPTYPFAQEHYWISNLISNETNSGNSKAKTYTIHPLLHQNTSDFSEQRFSSTFSGTDDLLADHLVKGMPVLPGVASLEMARAAVEQAVGDLKRQMSVSLKNIVWVRPIAVSNKELTVHIGLMLEDNGEISYKVYGNPETEGEIPLYGQGIAEFNNVLETPVLDIEGLKANCSESNISAEDFYKAVDSMGVNYGNFYKGIDAIFNGEGWILAKLSMPSQLLDTSDKYILHPAMMDSAIQASLGLQANLEEKGYPKVALPFSLQELVIYGPCRKQMWALVRKTDEDNTQNKITKIDIDLCDEFGKMCVQMKGFSSRVLDGEISYKVSKGLPEGPIKLIPVWDVVSAAKGQQFPANTERIVICGEANRRLDELKQIYPNAGILKLEPKDTIDTIMEKLNAFGAIDHIVWIAPEVGIESVQDDSLIKGQDDCVLLCFRLIKALLRLEYGIRNLGWTVITIKAQPINTCDITNPTCASLHGLIGSMASEYKSWKVRMVDIDNSCPLENVFTLAEKYDGTLLINREGEWYRQKLVSLDKTSNSKSAYKDGGIYVVIGGAGGIGEAWSEYMINTYHARIVWIGRREKDAAIQNKLDRLAALGEPPLYIRADACNFSELQKAYSEIKKYYSEIDGIVHSALTLQDQSLSNMEESVFKGVLSTKVDISVRIAQVFGKENLDFVLFFSSINSFVKSPGQSNYTAGCIFKDAFAQSLAREWKCAVKVVNWGYWGSIGAVASKEYQNRMAQMGIGSIEPCEAMDVLEFLLSSDISQLVFIKTAKSLLIKEMNPNEFIFESSKSNPSCISGLKEQLSLIAIENKGIYSRTNIYIDKIKSKLIQIVSQLVTVEINDIDTSSELDECGFDDVKMSELSSELNREFELNINPALLIEYSTVDKLTDYIIQGKYANDEGKVVSKESLTVSDFLAGRELKRLLKKGEELDSLLIQLLWCQLKTMGLFDDKSVTIERVLSSKLLAEMYKKWLQESIDIFVRNKYLERHGNSYTVVDTSAENMEMLWQQWDKRKTRWIEDPNLKSQVALVEKTMRVLPDIITAKIPATDVIFPKSSVELVEGVYKNNIISDFYNGIIEECLSSYMIDRIKHGMNSKIRIIEIGAGTGGTSAGVLKKLKPFSQYIEEYCFTDISKAFLLNAKEEYGRENSFMTFRLFDVEKPVKEQGFEIGEFDIVIATNVLHATKNIRRTIRNAKAMLCKSGLFFINEMSNSNIFTHLTFGLLEGWWLYEDSTLRIPGCPALYKETWEKVLLQEGFHSVFFPAQETHFLGQQVIIAESNGIILQKQQSSHAEITMEQPIADKYEKSKQISAKQQKRATEHTTNRMIEDRVKSGLRECISEAVKIEEGRIEDDRSFSEYGVDSIIAVNLVNTINKRFNIKLESTALFDYNNVKQLVGYIVQEYKTTLKATVPNTITESEITEIVQEEEQTPAASPQMPLKNRFKPINFERNAVNKVASETSSMQQNHEPIAIIGMSGRFAKSRTVEELWENLENGRDLVEKVSRWDISKMFNENESYCNQGSFLDDIDKFDPLFFNISELEATYMDPRQRFFLEESWKALEDAGYVGSEADELQCGVYVGCGKGDYDVLFGGNPPPQAFWGNDSAIIPARIAYYLNLQGPAIAIDTACSSSLVATHIACQSLWSGEIDMALAGGVYINCTPGIYTVGNSAEMLSPSGCCHTFDEKADGFVPGEGVGAIVLKRLKDAISDGDHIYGVIKGSAINQDGRTNGITAPSARSQERLERYVYDTFNINPENIQMIEAHGTGTKLGDPIEYNALTRAFRTYTDKNRFCAIGSIKSNMGHAAYAAGIAGIIKILLSLKNKKIPPSIHFNKGNTNIAFEGSPFYVNTDLQDWNVEPNSKRCAAISSFGFSGTNAHIIIEEAPELVYEHSEKPAYLITLSARSDELLRRQAENLIGYVQRQSHVDMGNISYTLLMGRKHQKNRLSCVVRNSNELVSVITKWLEKGSTSQVYSAELNDYNKREQPVLRKLGNQCIQSCIDIRDTNEYIEQLSAVAELYIQGYELNFGELFLEGKYSRISLPTYPFLQKSYWVKESVKPKNIIEVVGLADVSSEGNKSKNKLPENSNDDGAGALVDYQTAPRSELERKILDIWCEVLGSEHIGIYDNFQELGGDSIMATKVISRLEKSFPFDISLKSLFGALTIAGMAEIVEDALIEKIEGLPDDVVEQLMAK